MSAIPRSVADIDWASWTPVDLATLLFVVQDERVLLIRKKRGLGAGKINAPGGRLEPGETALAAAIREVQEELLIDARDVSHAGQHHFQFVDGYSMIVDVFRADAYDGVPTETDEAIPLWFGVDELPYDEMWEDDRLWVPLMLARRPFLGRYVFEDDAMLDYELDVDQVTESVTRPAAG